MGKLAPNFGYEIANKNEFEIGELILTGPQIAKGYVENQKLTEERFQFVDETGLFRKAYSTGDLVKLRNGLFYFMGRVDNQVKHMGYRIELEEVESYFQASQFVVECAVIHNTKIGQESRLELHLVHELDASKVEKVLDEIMRKLPTYMRPNKVHFHSVLPKNPNGKIDRGALADGS